MMKAIIVRASAMALLAAAGLAAAPADAQSRRAPAVTSLPQAVQGVWFKNDAYGRERCADYKRVANARDTDTIWQALVLANLITPRRMHAVAEYGEGNVYDVKSVGGDAKMGWTVNSTLTLDGGDPEPGNVRFQLKPLAGDKLQIMFVERGRITSTEVNFRCAPLSRFLLSQNR